MLKAVRMRARRRDDEGAIAIMAAAIIPIMVAVIALALASLVWGASETETQRASDQAALQTAASTMIVPSAGVAATPTYPNLNTAIPPAIRALPGVQGVVTSLSTPPASCKTVGNVYTSVSQLNGLAPLLGLVTNSTTLNNALNTLGTVNPSLANALKNPSTAACSTITVVPDTLLTSHDQACAAATAAMQKSAAPYSYSFFKGSGSAVPDCDANGRVQVQFPGGENNLLTLPGTSLGAGDPYGSGPITVSSTFNTVQTQLANLGVRLRTTLPNTLCPKISVGVDQPVAPPLVDSVAQAVGGTIATPNGRSTAQRVVKNAVIVPVFNGTSLLSPVTSVTGNVVPTIDLNSQILGPLQNNLLGALDAVDNAINGTLATYGTNVGSVVPGASLGQLDLLSCLHDTVQDIYNPPGSGSAPTTSQLTQTLTQQLQDAATSGDPVQIISVGVKNCAGAVSALDVYNGCLAPALGTTTGSVTGLYDIPALDVTPSIIKDIGGGNFQAVPVSAQQATGAFRSVLVRGSDDDRFIKFKAFP